MQLIFHGELRKKFGPSVTMHTDTVAEAIEGFSRQVDWPKEMLVDVVGYDSLEDLKTSADTVHIMPSMRGGGGKFGSIILGSVLIAAAFVLTATGAGVFAAPLTTSLFVSGSLMVLQGVVGLFLKAPKLKGVDDPDASKYLSVNKNTTAMGTPITLAWGKVGLDGHWLSLQSDSTNLSFGVFPANP